MFTIKDKTIYGQILTPAQIKAIKIVYKIITKLEYGSNNHALQDGFRTYFGITSN